MNPFRFLRNHARSPTFRNFTHLTIMFVYLDHAHFSALDAMLRREPDAFWKFLEFWLEQGCKLIVSRAHLHEIGQSVDERDVQKRLEVLRYFSTWSGDMKENVDWVLIREIRAQTLHLLRKDNERHSNPYAALQEEMYHRVDHDVLADFVDRSRFEWLEDQNRRKRMAAFENRSTSLRKEFKRLTGKKEPKWDPEGWRLLPLVANMMPVASGDPVADRWMAGVRERAPNCWRQSTRKRQALICIYDLGGLASLDRAPEQDLHRLGFYRALGRHWVGPYCRLKKYDPEAIDAALNSFDPYDAPAISVALAVERGRKTHEKKFEASDFMDVDHVLWAAYSDLAFIDKRTYGFLVQNRNNPSTARLLSPHISVKFERVSTLDDVKHHIMAITLDRSSV
jgi:hypothetical protein